MIKELLNSSGMLDIFSALGVSFLILAVAVLFFDWFELSIAYRKGVWTSICFTIILSAIRQSLGVGNHYAEGVAGVVGFLAGYMLSEEPEKQLLKKTKGEIAKSFFVKFAIGILLLCLGRYLKY